MYPKPNLIIPKTAFAARGFGRRKTGLESDTCCCQALDVTAWNDKCHYNQVMTLIHVLPKGLIILGKVKFYFIPLGG